MFNYVVLPGDSLFFIGQKFGVPLAAMIAANPQIPNPDLIYPGQIVHVPMQQGMALIPYMPMPWIQFHLTMPAPPKGMEKPMDMGAMMPMMATHDMYHKMELMMLNDIKTHLMYCCPPKKRCHHRYHYI